MSARRILAAALVLGLAGMAVLSSVSGDAKSPTRKTVYPKDLPPGVGQDIVQDKCLRCHSAMLITQQHKDSTSWEKTVTLMEKWGARIVPEDHATVIQYLVTSFGPAAPK